MTARVAIVALVLAASGCEHLLDLSEVKPLPLDSGNVIIVGDALTCMTKVVHDEDGDGLHDDCDPCPTVRDVAVADGDADGLPDTCDGDNAPNAPDAIARWWPLTDVADLTRSPTGTTVLPDAVQLAGNMPSQGTVATLATSASFAPTGIDVAIDMSQIDPLLGFTVSIAGGVSCKVLGQSCGATAGTCIMVDNPIMNTWPYPPSALRRISMWHDGNGYHCTAYGAMGETPGGASTTKPMGSGPVTLTAAGSTNVTVTSIVIYAPR